MKTNLDKFFKTDESLESQGIWFDVSETTGFLMKRFGGFNSPTVKSAMAKYYKPYARQMDTGTMDPQKEKEIMVRVFVEACLVDWKGVEIDGVETAFSKDVAVKLLCDLGELAETLMKYASDMSNYKEDVGNS